MSVKRFFVYSGVTLLLMLSGMRFVAMSDQPFMLFAIGVSNVTGWLMGRVGRAS